MTVKVALYERILSELLPSQPFDVQHEIRNALTEVRTLPIDINRLLTSVFLTPCEESFHRR